MWIKIPALWVRFLLLFGIGAHNLVLTVEQITPTVQRGCESRSDLHPHEVETNTLEYGPVVPVSPHHLIFAIRATRHANQTNPRPSRNSPQTRSQPGAYTVKACAQIESQCTARSSFASAIHIPPPVDIPT